MKLDHHHEVTINLYIHSSGDAATQQKLELILQRLMNIETKENKIMATLDETLAAVEAAEGKTDSVVALLTGIKAQLDAVLGGALPADVQAKVDAVFAAAVRVSDKIQAGIDANDNDPNTPPQQP